METTMAALKRVTGQTNPEARAPLPPRPPRCRCAALPCAALLLATPLLPPTSHAVEYP